MKKKARDIKCEPEEQWPQKVNECIAGAENRWERGQLFDAFWREGELALLFGPASVGKSLLAVQIADAAARGRGIAGFAMPKSRRKVLYVDLVMSDRQFRQRYTHRPRENSVAECYRFSDSMYKGRPQSMDRFGEWLRGAIAKDKFQAVIIDDLSAVTQTHQGTHETLKLMKELKQLKDETGISILVLAGSAEPRRNAQVSEADLGRRRVLADAADSVFAMGHNARTAGARYLLQTRSRTSQPVWNCHNAPVCRITRKENGLLGFAFDERFAEKIDDKTRETICAIKRMRDGGATFKTIGEKLGITILKASRWLKKWSPELNEMRSATDEHEQTPEDGFPTRDLYDGHCQHETEEWLATNEHEQTRIGDSETWRGGEAEPSVSDQQRAISDEPEEGQTEDEPRRRTIYDLERRLNDYDREIFVEKKLEDGRPSIWYQVDNLGYVHRWVRGGLGSTGKRIGPAPFLDP